MADFATLAEFEAATGMLGTGGRGTAMLGYASAMIRRYTKQDIEVTTGRQEEFAGGLGRHIITLTQHPVTAVTMTVEAVAFTDFTWSRWGDIHKDDWSSWDDGPIVVTYDSGYASTEDEFIAVRGICIEASARALGGPQDTFGIDVPELRGAPVNLFLTDEEKHQLDDLAAVVVG